MGRLLPECCDAEVIEFIALGGAGRVVILLYEYGLIGALECLSSERL